MTILEAIIEANTTAGIKTFAFATLKETQAFKASFSGLDYPANVVAPFDVPFTLLNGRRKSVIPLNGWVLKRLGQDTTNFQSAKIEELHLEPMRQLAFAFLKALGNSDIIDPEVEEISGVVHPEYGLIDQRLFGVSYTINLPIMQGIC